METGGSNREISDALYLSVSTVNSHMKSILRKTGVKTRTELVTHVFHNQITVGREVRE